MIEDNKEFETLRTQIKANEQYLDVFQRLFKHISDNGYIDFNSYKADKEFFKKIKKPQPSRDGDVHPKSWTKNLTYGVHFYYG